jgi:hypothetical protein
MKGKRAFIGFDGFVDTIASVVDHCTESGKVYIATIGNFGQRILDASGKSTNIELDVTRKKIGGNGPILSAALRELGVSTTYIGTIDHEIFAKFSVENGGISIGRPGETRALEFNDGKILLGEMHDVAKVNIDMILRRVGKVRFIETVSGCDLLCFVNWTMMTGLNGILEFLLGEAEIGGKILFFDLADPAKRGEEAIRSVCHLIGNFSERNRVILGLNLREAAQLLAAIGGDSQLSETRSDLLHVAGEIGKSLGIHACFIHANTMSAGYDGAAAFVTGYFSQCPKISTGAGDHFNAGFLVEYVDSFNLQAALHSGSAVAKYYVDNAISPQPMHVQQTRMD